ncbi:MAG: glutamate racemase [Myxococcaceae bacterium]|nr:glutamate racemase [Myxococcaceae bacterium]MBH2006670.1 glutamate racemase [Myxococcaceae bacterium]
MQNDPRSIGVFDSGLGGLTVLSAIRRKFPNESLFYLGDTARLPYGTKSPETVLKYALACAKALMKQAELKLLVIACNTATAHAFSALQDELEIPVVGVIESGVSETLSHVHLDSIAILATAGTIRSKAYERELKKQNFEGRIYPLACPLFVSLAEEGLTEGPIAQAISKHYLRQLPYLPDAVILGCTHYPLLLPTLKASLPHKTIWIDSGHATAHHLKFSPCLHQRGEARYFVTDAPERFQKVASQFLGQSIPIPDLISVD